MKIWSAMPIKRRLTATLSILTVLLARSLASSSIGSATTSPLQNWGPSWSASAAHGTTIALTCPQKEAVIVLLRTHKTRDAEKVDTVLTTTFDGVRLVAKQPSRSPPRWSLLGKSAACCMTGLVSDVEHLTRCLLSHVETHEIIYENEHPLGVGKLVNELSGLLWEATESDGRPFGVQALLIGSSLDIFTLDPSGGYHHWAFATAIGRAAANVRKHMYEELTKDDDQPPSAPETALAALHLAVKACTQAMNDSCHYEGLLIRRIDNELSVEAIDPGQIEDIRQAIEEARTLSSS
jgi:20S proteasome alpha/beta subunit